jgi:hypothetical protein
MKFLAIVATSIQFTNSLKQSFHPLLRVERHIKIVFKIRFRLVLYPKLVRLFLQFKKFISTILSIKLLGPKMFFQFSYIFSYERIAVNYLSLLTAPYSTKVMTLKPLNLGSICAPSCFLTIAKLALIFGV